jgi:hypothetical protein
MGAVSFPNDSNISAVISGVSFAASRAMITDGAGAISTSTVTATEISYMAGATSSIQTQLNNKEASFSKGNITSSAPISITNGTGVTYSNTVTINMTNAASGVNGYLSGSDWTVFNAKEPTVTKGNFTSTSPMVASGGTGSVIGAGVNLSIPTSTSGVNGYLSGTDWTTFNNKASGRITRSYYRPDIGSWNQMAFPMFMPSMTDACTILNVKVTVDGIGTTPTLKWNIEIRPASAQLSAGTKVWSSDKQTAEATALTEYNTFTNASLAAGDVLWFYTPSSGALVSGTRVDYIEIHVEYSRT